MAIKRIRTANRILEQRKVIPQPLKCGVSTKRVVDQKLKGRKITLVNKLCKKSK